MIKEIKFIFQNVPTKSTLAPDDFTDKLYQTFKMISTYTEMELLKNGRLL